MAIQRRKINLGQSFIQLLLTAVLFLPACSRPITEESEPIRIDGSSTVYPITEAILKSIQSQQSEKIAKGIKIKADFSGTGGGFGKFCSGETDINGASRPISAVEMENCNRNQVRYIELPIAFDAVTVAVNSGNDWVQSMTIAELKQIWEPSAQAQINNWQQVRASWPSRALSLYGPGKDSGTFDYFTEAIVGQAGSSRTDYVYSEDDEVLVNGIAQDPNALGYFGYAYYEQNANKLKAVAIDSGSDPVAPTRETVENGSYRPLTRPLFIYVNAKRAQENRALETFVEFYLDNAKELVSEVGYIPLPEEGYHLARIQFQKFEVGTVFEGSSEFNLTIEELLRKQAKFEPER
ncbi:phosphate binding protein [Crocosphaera subtropica ATCC 51142]|uniref:Phosphate-binding protein n=1 Tax=Crocosphaera subtropica (strain ATCC 51142 / BH68) TaxID=43989 RepID=B1X332_CROS5|nr:PstS family phosphate ABC transporter substrate-binding protein [Crocosphaera subtropica]ACB54543.1 phosphate binding protein [Crocosphaera subtropica ATCC 51142]